MSLRIAIVDDEPSVRKSLQRLMRTSGMEPEAFASGEEFLAGCPADFDCVLLDLHMSGTGGIEVAERLALVAPHLPILVLTGNDLPEFRAGALQAGVRAVLAKPSEAQVLLGAIREVAAPRAQAAQRVQKKAVG